jgi:hypothetical protein
MEIERFSSLKIPSQCFKMPRAFLAHGVGRLVSEYFHAVLDNIQRAWVSPLHSSPSLSGSVAT